MGIPENVVGNEIFKDLFNNSTVGMSVTSLDGRLHINSAFCEMIGYTEEELSNRNWADYTHPDDIAYNQSVLEKILSGKETSFRWEKRYLHKDGSTIWGDIHTVLHRDASGNPLHFITTINNITKRRIFEEALTESEQRFENLIRQMNEGVAIFDANGVFLFANPAAESILGVKSDGLVGKDIRTYFGEDHYGSLQNQIEKYLHGEKNSFDYEFKLNDGSDKILSGSATPRLKEHNRIEIHVLFRDITARKKVEEEIKRQNANLQLSNAEKDKFFSILAHDLRSPLSSFLGLTEVMAEDINSMTMSEIEEISKSLYLSASNLYQLLENLLEWSMLRRGNSKYAPEPTSLNRIILRCIDPFVESAHRKQIGLKVELDRAYQVECDQKMTETIFRNLISNALKYTNPGGSVLISAKQFSTDKVEISIKDTGIGMNAELHSKLFILNEQVSRKGTIGESSSGLGLLICKEFVERQGGKIWAESEENAGSTFYFTLKKAEDVKMRG